MPPSTIGVVIPAYNAEAFVGEAIRSVQAQTMPVAEVVVVDDGSTDQTAKAAEEHGARVIRQPHAGESKARNVGIRAVSETWIAFLDADDLWCPKKIERQWAAIERYPAAGLVTCDLFWFEGEQAPLPVEQQPPEYVTYFAAAPAEYLAADMKWFPSAAMVRREALLKAGLFDEGLSMNVDFDCFARIMAKWPIVVVGCTLAGHRCHAHNMSNDVLRANLTYITVVERMRAHPERYPPDVAKAYEPKFLDTLYKTGQLLLQQGKRRESRALFARRFWLRPSPRVMRYWCQSWLGAEDRRAE